MQIDLSQVALRLNRLRSPLEPWVRWWLDELRSLWSDALDRLLPSARTFTEIRKDGDALELVQRRGNVVLASHRLAEGDAAGLAGVSGSRGIILLPASEVLIKRLSLPAAVEPRLRQSLALRLDREMPLSADRVYFDCSVVRRRAETSTINVDLAVAKRTCVDAWEARVRDLHIRPVAIGLGATGDRSLRFNFLRGRAASSGSATHRFDRTLLATAVALAIALVGTVAWQWRAERGRVNGAIASISAVATAAQDSRRRLIAQVETARELRDHLNRPSFSVALTELTRSLGPEAWIHSLQFRGDELQISGVGPNPAALAGQLEQSAVFERTALKSTTSAGLGTGQDRFDMTLHTSGARP